MKGETVFGIVAPMCTVSVVACTSVTTEDLVNGQQELKQPVHKQISVDSCSAAGLPRKFCDRVGSAVQAVDTEDWDNNIAHAIPADGEGHCAAARDVIERLRSLGGQVRAGLEAGSTDVDSIAKNLAFALHTIQDNCSHEGMANVQHAWGTLGAECSLGPAGRADPDAAPGAAWCARQETDAIFAAFVEAISATGFDQNSLAQSTGWYWVNYPPVAGVCSWLRSYSTWDGTDTRWNNAVTVPGFRRELAGALTGKGSDGGDLCAFGKGSVENPSPNPAIKVVGGEWCARLTAYCTAGSPALKE